MENHQQKSTKVNSILASSLGDLNDLLNDIRRASLQNAPGLLTRLVSIFDSDPLKGFLGAILPPIEFETWWDATKGTAGQMVGSGVLNYPTDRATRVAIQIRLCRAIASNEIDILNFTMHFCYPGRLNGDMPALVKKFAADILEPLFRDIERLAETRVMPPGLLESFLKLPISGDQIIDKLIEEACRKFRDVAPHSQREAVECMWDAWERLKSLNDPTNKRISATKLLDQAAAPGAFRDLLEEEAKAITAIGNNFHIRHFETDRHEVTDPAHFEYLFHRIYAIINLLLSSRKNTQ